MKKKKTWQLSAMFTHQDGSSPIRAVSLWNMFDEDLRNATTVKALKKALKLVMNEWLNDSLNLTILAC